MYILENYSCFQQFFFKFSIFYPKNIFEDFFFSEPGHIPDFENQDNISIGIS